jgi:uncharacterized membrane protein
MSLWLIIVIVLVVLIVGGIIGRFTWLRRTESRFRARLEQANHDLAEAAAEDRGWDRERLEEAARRGYAEQHGTEPSELLLVEVVDRPGTEDDLAVFRCETEGARHTVTLGRHGDEWVLDRVE